MPGLGGHIVNPCCVGAGKRQHIKGVAFLLVGVGQRVSQVTVLGNRVLNRMGRNPKRGVTVGLVDNTLTTGVCTEPEQGVIKFGDREGGYTANLIESALNGR